MKYNGIDLRNCPFCGGNATKMMSKRSKSFRISGDRFGKILYDNYYVACNSCHARGGIGKTEDEAIDSWNGIKDGQIVLDECEEKL